MRRKRQNVFARIEERLKRIEAKTKEKRRIMQICVTKEARDKARAFEVSNNG
jgi:hydrogenase maturation factor